MIHPLKELDAAAKKFAEGDFDVSITADTKDEIGTLAKSFSETADRLKAQMDYINSLAYTDSLTGINNNTASLFNTVSQFRSIPQIKDGENWENTSDDSIAILTAYTYTDFVGETASSTALAGTGYKFEGWYNANGEKVTDTDMLSSDGMTLSYTTTEDATYYARFERYVPPEETTTVSEEITTVPEETTTVSEEITTVPEEITTVPEEITTVPEETTTVSEEITTVPEETTTVSEETTTVSEEITTVPEETTTTVPDCTVTSVPEETTTGDIGESTIFSSETVTTTSNSTVTSHVTSICTTVTTTDPLEYYSDFYTITTKQTTDSGEDVAAGAGVNADEDEVSGSADAKVLIPTGLFLSAAFIGLALFSRKLRHK